MGIVNEPAGVPQDPLHPLQLPQVPLQYEKYLRDRPAVFTTLLSLYRRLLSTPIFEPTVNNAAVPTCPLHIIYRSNDFTL